MQRIARSVEAKQQANNKQISTLEGARCLACSVDDVNVPFDAGIIYVNKVVSIVNLATMTIIRRYAKFKIISMATFPGSLLNSLKLMCIGCQHQLTG